MYIQVMIFEIIFYIITILNVIVKKTIHSYLLEVFSFFPSHKFTSAPALHSISQRKAQGFSIHLSF